jgi:predicted transcriptional regulator
MATIKRTIELNERTDAALEKAAAASGLSPSAFLQSALDQLLPDNDDLTEEMRRWEQYQRDGKSVSADEVNAWIDSLGTASPLPKPRS